MADEKTDLTRRDAVKSIAVGVGVGVALPVLRGSAHGQHQHGADHGQQGASKPADDTTPWKPKFFNEHQDATIVALSETIIPADDRSPGAKAAAVNQFIDLMVDASPDKVKQDWTDGLALIDKLSNAKFSQDFASASPDQQVSLLKEISKNERNPQAPEERFFRTLKNLTIDGYYTSEIGIHKELQYKGNAYLKEFVGCTHPEHMGQ